MAHSCHNSNMIKKKRNDRNYVIYLVTCQDTNDTYIGVTVATGRAFLKSVKIRWQKHVSRAKCETKNWNLCEFIRRNKEATFTYEILEVVRGRKNAYAVERGYIYDNEPTLNTF